MMNVDVGGYHVGDVEVSAAFDVDARKVGRDVAEAICAAPNNTIRFAEVKPTVHLEPMVHLDLYEAEWRGRIGRMDALLAVHGVE